MKYELIIRDEAERDIIETTKYYETQQTGLGIKFLEQLEQYLERIQTHPELFQIKRPPYREAFIKKFPYLIIYEFIENKVVVYAVFNTRKNPDKKP